MDRLCQQLFARAGLPKHEHRGVSSSNLLHLGKHVPKGPAFPDDLTVFVLQSDLFTKIDILLFQPDA